MLTSLRTAAAVAALAAAAIATVLATALPAAAADQDNGPVIHAPTRSTCTALDAQFFDVEIDTSGNGNVSVGDDGIVNCNEWVGLSTYANSSAVVDNHEPQVDSVVMKVHDLEAAGPAGIDFSIALDPCWSGFEVHRDGDTLVHQEMIGIGCEMTIDTDFTGSPASADIHVVQQTGEITPPHMWSIDADDTTTLTGMPSGTWYVKVYDGFTRGSSISAVGVGSTSASTLHGVPNGSHVDIEIVTPLGFTTLQPTVPIWQLLGVTSLS